MDEHYGLPSLRLTDDGRERRVGVELEFAGLRPAEIVDIVRKVFGGEATQHSALHFDVHTDIGDIEVELDARWAKQVSEGLQSLSSNEGPTLTAIGSTLEDAFESLTRKVIPCEVVLPPLPLSQLHCLDPLVLQLREAGALGTRESMAYAFGLQFNPEVPALRVEVILRYLQAFMCLYEWLAEGEQIPLQRRVLPFINPFPKDYVKLLLQDSYAPTMTQLIDDYLQYNATRNRVLDMLPLFAYIDDPRVRAAVGTQKVNARPTFHYRLPNSDIDQPGWTPRQAWTRWLQVEHLAASPERLAACRRAWLEYHELLSINLTSWHKKVTEWLTPAR